MLRRAFIPAVALVALAFCIPFLRPAPVSSEAGVHRVQVPDNPEYSIRGLNETLAPVYAYVGLVESNRVRAVLEAELARRADVARSRASRSVPNNSTAVDWDGIAQCETGSNWSHQTRYDGGLGILHVAWLEFGGRDFAEYGSQATREEQIIVAERLYARHGLSGWGCRAYG